MERGKAGGGGGRHHGRLGRGREVGGRGGNAASSLSPSSPRGAHVPSPSLADSATARARQRRPRVEVRTVDGFQGGERDVVIFSAVRSNADGRLGFLSDARRANVALTRARAGLVVVGDAGTLSAGRGVWREWLAWAATVGGIVPAASSGDIEGSSPDKEGSGPVGGSKQAGPGEGRSRNTPRMGK